MLQNKAKDRPGPKVILKIISKIRINQSPRIALRPKA
jgi:hypothetical protein